MLNVPVPFSLLPTLLSFYFTAYTVILRVNMDGIVPFVHAQSKGDLHFPPQYTGYCGR